MACISCGATSEFEATVSDAPESGQSAGRGQGVAQRAVHSLGARRHSQESLTCCKKCLSQPEKRCAVHHQHIGRLEDHLNRVTRKWQATFLEFPDALCDRFTAMRAAWMWGAIHVKTPIHGAGFGVVNDTDIVCGKIVPKDIALKITRTIENDRAMAKLWNIYAEFESIIQTTHAQIGQHQLAFDILSDELEKVKA